MTGSEAVPLEYKMTPTLLKRRGYYTAALGKWNLGSLTKQYTPTYRGFDHFFGYYAAATGDYWYDYRPGKAKGTCNATYVTDLSNNTGDTVAPASHEVNGTYNLELFTSEAERLIALSISEPKYIYLAYQNVHCAAQDKAYLSGSHPLHAPCTVVDSLYSKTKIDTYKVMGAMISELDSGVGRVISSLKAQNRPWLLALNSDNGGPLEHSTNSPWRGGKHTLWEGGTRVIAFITGSMIPEARRGVEWSGMAHSSDWYRTISVGVAGCPYQWTNGTGPRQPDGFNLLPSILSGRDSPRTEVIHQVQNKFSAQMPGNRPQFPASIRAGRYKLFLNGNPGDSRLLSWPIVDSSSVPFGQSNGSRNGYPQETNNCRATTISGGKDNGISCTPGCLFDLESDPTESKNLFHDKSVQSVVTDLTNRLKAAAATGGPWAEPFNGSATSLLDKEICEEELKTGYVEPVRTSYPVSPPPGPAPSPENCKTVLAKECHSPKSYNSIGACMLCAKAHKDVCSGKECDAYCLPAGDPCQQSLFTHCPGPKHFQSKKSCLACVSAHSNNVCSQKEEQAYCDRAGN